MKPLHPLKALYDAKKVIAQIVTDVVNLEGIHYTVPEVQTLLDGITVGGHKIQDEQITLNQINAWRFLFQSLEEKQFQLNKVYAFQLHDYVAYREALTWGCFRNGRVSIAGTSYNPPDAIELEQLWNELIEKTQRTADTQIYQAAIELFAEMARLQFFFDGNKRTGRMMMSGLLLSQGYPMINVPAARQTEFNQIMIDYYNTRHLPPVYSFLWSCLSLDTVREYNLHPFQPELL